MFLNRIIYRSDAALVGTPQEIEHQLSLLVDEAATANQRIGLTGALLLASGVFVQALEGPRDAVEATFERICCDTRHRRVRLLDVAAVEQRTFADWSMAQIPLADLRDFSPMLASAETTRLDPSAGRATLAKMLTLLRASSILHALKPHLGIATSP